MKRDVVDLCLKRCRIRGTKDPQRLYAVVCANRWEGKPLLKVVCLHIPTTSELFFILKSHMLWWCVYLSTVHLLMLRLAIALVIRLPWIVQDLLTPPVLSLEDHRNSFLLCVFVGVCRIHRSQRGSKIQSLDREMHPRGRRHPCVALRGHRSKRSPEDFIEKSCGDRKVARFLSLETGRIQKQWIQSSFDSSRSHLLAASCFGGQTGRRTPPWPCPTDEPRRGVVLRGRRDALVLSNADTV